MFEEIELSHLKKNPKLTGPRPNSESISKTNAQGLWERLREIHMQRILSLADQTSNTSHIKSQNLNVFRLSRLAVVFAQSFEARC